VRRPVQTGLETGAFVQILDGVAAGDDVIVRGQESLKDGAPVKVMGPKKDGPKKDGAPAQKTPESDQPEAPRP